MRYFSRLINKVPRSLRYILALFLTTRVALTIIGVVSRLLLEPHRHKYFEAVYPRQLWLNIWVNWDAGWYLRIASFDWYSQNARVAAHKGVFGFFPAYPFLIRIIGFILHNNVTAGILISNFFLLVASVFLYKLVKLNDDLETSLRSVKYLFFFPSAFIFSGVFNDSLYLALTLISFYYAKKDNFIYAAITGFFIALTKPQGAFIIFPLLYLYLKNKDFRLGRIKIDIIFLLLIPLGLAVFLFYTHYLTGDWLKGCHVAGKLWGFGLHNPFRNITTALFFRNDISVSFPIYFSSAMLLVFLLFYRQVEFSYWLFGATQFLLSFSYGSDVVLLCLLRHILPIFPLYIIFARLGKDRQLDLMSTVFFVLLQGFLMVFWCNGFTIVM